MVGIKRHYQSLVHHHKLRHNGNDPSLMKCLLYAFKAFGYSVRKDNAKKNIVSGSGQFNKDSKLNSRSVSPSETPKNKNKYDEIDNNERSIPLKNYEFIWSKMKAAECSDHLETIKKIEAVVIESLKNGEITEQHILSIKENLSQWEKLSPNTQIPQRDNLKSILSEPEDPELKFKIRSQVISNT